MNAITPPSAMRMEAATEELYALLPAHIRTVDAKNGWALKGLVRVLAEGTVLVDREIDMLLDSMFVETAPEAALAELAALVASEPLRPPPGGSGFSSRTFIANTVRYRRGKGTARVLEQLTADVAGMGAVAVEYFQRLARLTHLIDFRAERPGTAFLVPGVTASRTATSFDVLPRLVDVRSIARAAGRHHVRNVGVHVLRPVVSVWATPAGGSPLGADKLAGVPPARGWPNGNTVSAGYYQLSEQPGRALRLFNPDRRSETDLERAVETDLPDRLRRLPLHLETDALRLELLGRPVETSEPPWFDSLGQPFTIFLRRAGSTTFARVAPRQVLIANLESLPSPAGSRPQAKKTYSWFEGKAGGAQPKTGDADILCGFDPVTGRLIVVPPAVGEQDVEEVRVAYATGSGREIGAGPHDRNSDDVPFDIVNSGSVTHFVRVVDDSQAESGSPADALREVKTLKKALAEWSATGGPGKRGFIILVRCGREAAAGNAANVPVKVHPDSELHIVAAQWREKKQKPGIADNAQRLGYLVRRDRRFTIDSPVQVTAASAPPSGGDAGVLVLDGLELTRGITLGAAAVSRLLVRHCTVRAPGKAALATGAALTSSDIAIDRSVLGRISLDTASGIATGTLTITGSIVSADEATAAAVSATSLDARLDNVTLFGTSTFKSLEATNVIFSEAVTVKRRQSGCIRFSWVATGSAAPRRYRCQPDLAIETAAAKKAPVSLTLDEGKSVALGVTPLFLDESLDEPTVGMLHPLTKDAIRLGGEGDTEMGAFSAAAEGLRLANLTSLFDDYVPFGLEAGVIDDTRSSAVALRRNRP
jgi:hypothetical protein